jgi:hypothetical protein
MDRVGVAWSGLVDLVRSLDGEDGQGVAPVSGVGRAS